MISRILFIYAKLNPGLRYTQGMNEIIAVVYFCFSRQGADSVIAREYLESDVFYCFTNLMSEIKDGFMRELDKEEGGIQGKCQAFLNIIDTCDPDVSNRLKETEIDP